jgi:hypothetical protein
MWKCFKYVNQSTDIYSSMNHERIHEQNLATRNTQPQTLVSLLMRKQRASNRSRKTTVTKLYQRRDAAKMGGAYNTINIRTSNAIFVTV